MIILVGLLGIICRCSCGCAEVVVAKIMVVNPRDCRNVQHEKSFVTNVK